MTKTCCVNIVEEYDTLQQLNDSLYQGNGIGGGVSELRNFSVGYSDLDCVGKQSQYKTFCDLRDSGVFKLLKVSCFLFSKTKQAHWTVECQI